MLKCIDSMPMFEFIQKHANEDALCWLVLVNLTQTWTYLKRGTPIEKISFPFIVQFLTCQPSYLLSLLLFPLQYPVILHLLCLQITFDPRVIPGNINIAVNSIWA